MAATATQSDLYGRVKFFDTSKGFGFIEALQPGERDIYVHYKQIIGEGFRTLVDGQRVKFKLVNSPKGPAAADVRVVEESQ